MEKELYFPLNIFAVFKQFFVISRKDKWSSIRTFVSAIDASRTNAKIVRSLIFYWCMRLFSCSD